MTKIVPALALTAFLCGCGTPVRHLHRADLYRLPQSKGVYGGSIGPQHDWVYLGSDDRDHHFLYTYTRDNRYYQRRILVPKKELALSFETPLAEAGHRRHIDVYPLIRFQEIYGFVRLVPPPRIPDTEELGWHDPHSGFENPAPIKAGSAGFE